MTSNRFLMILTALVACVGFGCSPRSDGDKAGSAMAPLADTDFAQASDKDYAEAARRVGRALGRDFSDLPGRSYGPKAVLPVGSQFLVVAVAPGADAELVILALVGSRVEWQAELPVASGTLVTEAGLVDHADHQLLRLGLAQAGGIDAVFVHPGTRAPAIVRAEQQGAVANAALLAAHPALPTQAGDLGSDDVMDQLAATVHLAADDQAAVRGSQLNVGHLQALAGSTNPWLAAAAASLLTMPTE